MVKPYNLVFLQFKHTPLHLAAIYGKEAVVEFLVTKGADLNAMDEVSINKSNKEDSD